MNLAAPHRVAAEFAGSDEDGEDAVTAAGLQVHGGLAHVAVGVTDEEVVESLLFAARRVRRQVAEVYVAVTVLPEMHARQLLLHVVAAFEIICQQVVPVQSATLSKHKNGIIIV